MKKTLLVFLFIFMCAGIFSSVSDAAALPGNSADYQIFSNDGKTYLGSLDRNKYSADSIFNVYGTYGGKYSATSIWNNYGLYGDKYAATSAMNKYATDPPLLAYRGSVIGYVTVNTNNPYGVSPYILYSLVK
jgi:hypothetical protein